MLLSTRTSLGAPSGAPRSVLGDSGELSIVDLIPETDYRLIWFGWITQRHEHPQIVSSLAGHVLLVCSEAVYLTELWRVIEGLYTQSTAADAQP